MVVFYQKNKLEFPYLRSEKKYIKIPMDIEDVKMLAKVLDQYKDMYYFQVMGGITVTYILYHLVKYC